MTIKTCKAVTSLICFREKAWKLYTRPPGPKPSFPTYTDKVFRCTEHKVTQKALNQSKTLLVMAGFSRDFPKFLLEIRIQIF